MFVQLRGVKRDGYPGVWCAGRFWPSNETQRVEVVDEEPPMVEQPLVTDGKITGSRLIFDMTKIGKKSFKEIQDDGRITILQDGEAESDVSELQAKVSALTAERDTLRARVAELESSVPRDRSSSDRDKSASAKR